MIIAAGKGSHMVDRFVQLDEDQRRGLRLRTAMVARGYAKQHAFAVALNVSQSTVTRWLANGPMSLESAAEICSLLDISMNWLVLGRGEMSADLESQRKDTPSSDGMTAMIRLYEALPTTSRSLLDSFLRSIAT
jgi:transcriptional regulator with XRE-family HTH domain